MSELTQRRRCGVKFIDSYNAQAPYALVIEARKGQIAELRVCVCVCVLQLSHTRPICTQVRGLHTIRAYDAIACTGRAFRCAGRFRSPGSAPREARGAHPSGSACLARCVPALVIGDADARWQLASGYYVLDHAGQRMRVLVSLHARVIYAGKPPRRRPAAIGNSPRRLVCC